MNAASRAATPTIAPRVTRSRDMVDEAGALGADPGDQRRSSRKPSRESVPQARLAASSAARPMITIAMMISAATAGLPFVVTRFVGLTGYLTNVASCA